MKTLTGKSLPSTNDQNLKGKAIVSKTSITFLGFINYEGTIVDKTHELFNQGISNRVFIFPKGIGSTVGPYVLLNLKKNKKAPLAIINRESDQGTISGCSIAKIPLIYEVDKDPTSAIKNNDYLDIKIKDKIATIKISSS